MSYVNGLLDPGSVLSKARQWLKSGIGVYSNGKVPADDAEDNNYQWSADNAAGTGWLPSHKINTSNQFEINNGHAVIDGALTLNSLAAPATPKITQSGTAGATSYSYIVVGRSAGLSASSAAATTALGAAILTSTNYNTITWTPTSGFLAYDIYRSASSGTPSSTGLIGSVSAAFGPNFTTPTLSFNDTGLTGDSSTAPATNTTGAFAGDMGIYGNLSVNALGTPATPLVMPNTTGATTWAYEIVARSGTLATATGHSAASAAGQTTTGVASITGAANGNTITWQPVPGAVSYDIYRTTAGTSPSSTGKIANVAGRSYVDIGGAGDSSTAPTTNTTGQFTVPSGSVTSSELDPQTIQYVTVPVTVANFIAMNTVPVVLVAAKGAGTFIEPVSLVINLQYGSAAFAGGGAVGVYLGTSAGTLLTAALAATIFTTFSANKIASTYPAALGSTATASGVLNTAAVLSNPTANFTGGTGATIIIKFAYRVHNTLA